jgi:hypothetical protein
MSPQPNHQPIPALTPEQQSIFFDLVKSNTPAWLLAASAPLRAELYESLNASHRSRSEVSSLLKTLQSPEDFCTPLLAKAMSDKLGAPLEVAGVVFQHVRSTSSLLGLRRKLVLPIDRNLLSAACENFELNETLPGNYNDASLLYIPEKITGHAAKILSIKPHEFAGLCRTLDLGKQYQTHLKNLFEPVSERHELRDKYIAHARNSFEVSRHAAFMQKHISAQVHQTLKAVTSRQPVTLGNNTLGYQALKLFGVTLNGAMFIGPVKEHDDDDNRCVVYLPGDPQHPLKEYASFTDFEVALSRRLRQDEYRRWFMRYIKLADRSKFLKNLDEKLLSPNTSPLPRHTVYVSLSGDDITGDIFQQTFLQYSDQVMADARILIVPTDDEDEKSRLERLQTYTSIGINLVLFGASFLPVVGEVLLAVTAVQLLSQVYEGIASWSRGELEEATDYLFDTVENLILMAAFAAGTAAAASAYKTIRASLFIEGLRKVTCADSRSRLWKPDLSPYHQSRTLPQGSAPDTRGLHWADGQAYLPIDAAVYAVRPKTGTDLWEVLAPKGTGETYNPVLETNDVGAWRHDSELLQEWDRLKLFRRFGYSRDDVPDNTAAQIIAVCGIEDAVMRQAHISRSHPPALLVDTVHRFRADAAVTRFIEQIKEPSTATLADPDLQLHLLTTSERWPGSAAIKVVNASGGRVSFHGAANAQAGETLSLNQDALDKGRLHTSLLSALSSSQREQLLNTKTTDAAAQGKALTTIIAEQAERNRPGLFARIYQRTEAPNNARVAVLMKRFDGLPAAVADELVRHAESGEWDELDDDKVPLRLAEEASRFMQRVRVSRAYEGLYLNAAGGSYTDRLVLDTLEQLPGWTGNVRVQIRESSGHHNTSTSIGVASDPEKVQVNVHADRYSVFVDTTTPSTTFSQRTRDHYFQALWHGLSARRKTLLGVHADDAGAALREKITERALQRRQAVAQLMDDQPSRPGYTSPMRLADRPLAMPSTGHSNSLAIITSHDVLVRRALELYPLHSPRQIYALINVTGTNVILSLKKLEAMRQEFLAIREDLSRWVNRQTWHQAPDGPRLEVPRLSKSSAAQAIIRSWRKEPQVIQSGEHLLGTLRLAAQPLGELPAIVGDFSHIGRLVMDGVGASAGLNHFLKNFDNLRTLSLRGNHLTRLPQALTGMSRLVDLDLSNNLIQLTPASQAQLAGMTGLQSMNLAFNPSLTRAPDVSRMQHLERLSLQGAGINQWPAGAVGLPRLRELDLRDNRIDTLPDEVLKGNPLPNMGTNLHGNPLSPDTFKGVSSYQQRTGVSLGIIASAYRRLNARSVTDATQVTPWLTGLDVAKAQTLRGLWASLQAYPESTDFFNVIARLSDIADYKRLYSSFSQRVWNVLEAAGEDDRLRRALFRLARLGRISADGYSASFSEMEVLVLCYQANTAATTGAAPLEQQFIGLLRGLFRLQEVERFALADINTRSGSQQKSYDHALEISLAYRVGLSERLGLPSQPRTMTSPWNVEVTPAMLERVYQAVLTTERSSALLEWIIGQRFWVEYLESAHQDRFFAVSDRSAQAFAQLEGQFELTREVASERMNALIDNFQNERRDLLRQLTAPALARHRAPEVPSTSSSSGASR